MSGVIRDPHTLTPVERQGRLWLKRDDLFMVGEQCGGKARACVELAQGATTGLVTASARQSPQAAIVAAVAHQLGIPCRVHTPTGASTPELEDAIRLGAVRIAHRPGYNRVIVARAREDCRERDWLLIPFGMECEEALRLTALQVRNVPSPAQRLVVAVGSGISLAGILLGLRERSGPTPSVLGVVIGADPTRRLDRWAPGWREKATLVPAGVEYHQPAGRDTLGGVRLDPIYEAKCLPFLRDGDCFWVVGLRGSAARER